jgi:hypothetical protein
MGLQELKTEMFRYTRVKQDNAALTARIHMLEEHIREIEVGPFIKSREIEVGQVINIREIEMGSFINIRDIEVGHS